MGSNGLRDAGETLGGCNGQLTGSPAAASRRSEPWSSGNVRWLHFSFAP